MSVLKWGRPQNEFGSHLKWSSKLKMFELFSTRTFCLKWVRTQNEFGTHFRTHPRDRTAPICSGFRYKSIRKFAKKRIFGGHVYFAHVSYYVHPLGLTSPPEGGSIKNPGETWAAHITGKRGVKKGENKILKQYSEKKVDVYTNQFFLTSGKKIKWQYPPSLFEAIDVLCALCTEIIFWI